MIIEIFWYVMQCHLVNDCQCFEGPLYFHFHSQAVLEEIKWNTFFFREVD